MAGFTPEEKHYDIKFEPGHPLHGLELTMGSLTVEEYNSMMVRSLVTDRGQVIEANSTQLDLFVSKLLHWNLTDRGGKAVPRTRDGVNAQDRGYIGQMVNAWQFAMLGISADLGKDLSSGEQSQEEQLGLGT